MGWSTLIRVPMGGVVLFTSRWGYPCQDWMGYGCGHPSPIVCTEIRTRISCFFSSFRFSDITKDSPNKRIYFVSMYFPILLFRDFYEYSFPFFMFVIFQQLVCYCRSLTVEI